MKSNADYLRELINSDSYSKEEALEFITAMEDELRDTEQSLKDEEREKEQLQQELSDVPRLNRAFLGLDTLYYNLDQGNLKIKHQLESWINNIKEQNGIPV